MRQVLILKSSRFNEQQIIEILEETKTDKTIADIAAEYRISTSTIYHWRRKYSLQNAEHLHSLEQEVSRLRELVSNLTMEKDLLKTVLLRHGWKLEKAA
jgi:putative transposase